MSEQAIRRGPYNAERDLPVGENAMSASMQAVLDSALLLSEDERIALADELFASVDPEPVADEELLAELDRRAAELQLDPAAGIPWGEVKNLR